MPNSLPNRRKKQGRLAAALKELGHALLAVYPDAEGAILVLNRPTLFGTVTLPLIAPEAGLPEPEGEAGKWAAGGPTR
jgi:hypothetical protein